MKKIALFFLLLISVSYAEFCERPYKPDCVNKTSANESEFNACKQNMEKYLIKVDSFIACLENTTMIMQIILSQTKIRMKRQFKKSLNARCAN